MNNNYITFLKDLSFTIRQNVMNFVSACNFVFSVIISYYELYILIITTSRNVITTLVAKLIEQYAEGQQL